MKNNDKKKDGKKTLVEELLDIIYEKDIKSEQKATNLIRFLEENEVLKFRLMSDRLL